jgi:hypothetical protein
MGEIPIIGAGARRKFDSKLHQAATLFEREGIVSFGLIVVYPDGRVDCSYDAGADTSHELVQQFGKIMAGCSSLEGTLAGKVVEMGPTLPGLSGAVN